MVDVRASNDKLRDRAARIICTLCPWLTRDEVQYNFITLLYYYII